jgi:MPBQ/MSBQ methyltransferase
MSSPPSRTALDLELLFAVEVLQMESLHYGYWEQPQAVIASALDLPRIRRAQSDYTATLLELLPANVQSVLDVGCGIGDVARAMSARGCSVTALSPDRNHGKFFTPHDARIQFLNRRIEDLALAQRFDAVLMSESNAYFPIDVGLARSRQQLRPGGYLLISGLFKRGSSVTFSGFPIEGAYLEAAQRHGFRLLQRIDITEQVLPTLQFAHHAFTSWLLPVKATAAAYLEEALGWRLKLLRWLFRKELGRLARVEQYYAERLDPELFRQHKCYVRLLFQHCAPDVSTENSP